MDRHLENEKTWAEKVYYENSDLLKSFISFGSREDKMLAYRVYKILELPLPEELHDIESKLIDLVFFV